MNVHERCRYHQIHPAKLAIDICSTIAGRYLRWTHQAAAACVCVPPMLASAGIFSGVDLRRRKASALGRYSACSNPRPAEGVLSVDMFAMALGG